MKDDFAEAREENEEPGRPAENETPREPSEPVSAAAKPEKQPFLQTAKQAADKALDFILPVLHSLGTAGRALRRFFKKDSLPNYVLVLALVSAAAAAAVGLTHGVTEPRIIETREKEIAAAMETVFPGENLSFARSSFGDTIYEGRDEEGRLAGFSILVSPRGYTGPVDIVVGISITREVTGVTVTRHRELGDLSQILIRGIDEALAIFDGEVWQ